jgi:hypothetical protein
LVSRKAGVLEMFQTGTLDIEALCDLARAEYQEMPGLCLTEPQMCRLWDLDRSACDLLLQHLLEEGIVRHAGEDKYVLARQSVPQRTAASQTPTRK